MKDKMLQEKVHLLIDLTQPLSHSLVFVIGQGDLISIQILWIRAAFSRVGCLQGNIACYREQWVSPPPKKLSSKFLPTILAYRLSLEEDPVTQNDYFKPFQRYRLIQGQLMVTHILRFEGRSEYLHPETNFLTTWQRDFRLIRVVALPDTSH